MARQRYIDGQWQRIPVEQIGGPEDRYPRLIDAIEVEYYLFDQDKRERLLALAERYDLLVDGGSDFHERGEHKGVETRIGWGNNNIHIRYETTKAIRDASVQPYKEQVDVLLGRGDVLGAISLLKAIVRRNKYDYESLQ